MTPNTPLNPWPGERVVVVSDDPPAVEAAVTQLEAWGAQPAVMFERSRAMAALTVREPDMVVLDFGRGEDIASEVLVRLEELQPVLPGAAHPAPVVALAEGSVGARLEQDAWAPLHVTPHDDPLRVREALLAALEDTVGAEVGGLVGLGADEAAAPDVLVAGPVGRRMVAPVIAAAAAVGLAGLGGVAFVALQAGGAMGGPAPTTAPAATPSSAVAPAVATAGVTTGAPTASASGQTVATALPPGPTSTLPPAAPTQAAAAPTQPAAATPPPAVAPTLAPSVPTRATPPAGPTVASAPATSVPITAFPGSNETAGSTAVATAAPRLPITGSR